MGIAAAGVVTGNLPASPPNLRVRPQISVHGTALAGSHGRRTGAQPLGRPVDEAARGVSTAPGAKPLAPWVRPLMRQLAQGLWVVVSTAPVAALSAIPLLAWLNPSWSWPLLGAAVGFVLIGTTIGCLYGIAWLEKRSAGRPTRDQLSEPSVAELGATAASAAAPRGYTALSFHPPGGPTAARTAQLPLPSMKPSACAETTTLFQDLAGVEQDYRSMRSVMGAQAFAKAQLAEQGRSPWKKNANWAADGMSYSQVFGQQRDWANDSLVLTVAEGMGFLSADGLWRAGLGEFGAGLAGGGTWDRTFALFSGQLGATNARGVGGKLSGTLFVNAEASRTVRAAPDHPGGVFVGHREEASAEAVLEDRAYVTQGRNAVPSVARSLAAFGPLRALLRCDRRSTQTQVWRRGGGAKDAVGWKKGKPGHDVHGLRGVAQWGSQDQATLTQATYRGDLGIASMAWAALGWHNTGHVHSALSAAFAARVLVVEAGVEVWRPQLELTFTHRQQGTNRWLAGLSGGLGVDAGRREFTDERESIFLVARPSLGEALEKLWLRLRLAPAADAQRASWNDFCQQHRALVRRERSTGWVRSREAGVNFAPVGIGILRNACGLNLPKGFAEGLLPWQRGEGVSQTVRFRPVPAGQPSAVVESVRGGLWRQPLGVTAGPQGSRSLFVAAQLERSLGSPPQLQLLSRWDMGRADADEVESFVLTPLRRALGLGDTFDTDGLLDASAWRASNVAHWRTSRQVDLETRFNGTELEQLAHVDAKAWDILPWDEGVDAQCGVRLSAALRTHLGQLSAKLGAEDPAWQALQDAASAFVAETKLAAPSLLRQALAVDGLSEAPNRMVLRTASAAYNEPQETLQAFLYETTAPEDAWPKDLVKRLESAQLDARAAMDLARVDALLDRADREAYRSKLGRIVARLRGLQVRAVAATKVAAARQNAQANPAQRQAA